MNDDLKLAYGIGFVFAVLLYGAYAGLFFMSPFSLFRQNSRSTRSFKIVSAMNYFLFICSTLYTGITMSQLMKAFITNPGGPTEFLAPPTSRRHWENPASLILHFVIISVFNILMIDRCYLIWSGNLRAVLIQILLELTTIALSIASLVSFPLPQIITPNIQHNLVLILRPLQLAQSLLNTGLIVLRLLKQHYSSVKAGLEVAGITLACASWMVIESAAIYTSLLLCLTTLTALNSVYAYTLQEIVSPTIGIALNLIVVRAYLTQPSPEVLKTPSKIVFRGLLPTSGSEK